MELSDDVMKVKSLALWDFGVAALHSGVIKHLITEILNSDGFQT